MKSKLVKRAAQAKANVLSKDAVNNTTEVVMYVLVTVIIVAGVAVAMNKIIGDESSGILKTISDKFAEVQTELTGAGA